MLPADGADAYGTFEKRPQTSSTEMSKPQPGAQPGGDPANGHFWDFVADGLNMLVRSVCAPPGRSEGTRAGVTWEGGGGGRHHSGGEAGGMSPFGGGGGAGGMSPFRGGEGLGNAPHSPQNNPNKHQ